MASEPRLVSVIIPTYNSTAYIREAVESALAQTYPRVEIVVVDDGSTDDTREILEPYIQQGKIVYIYQANKGLSGARNTAIRAAKGEFIALLDADDMFLPDKLEHQIRYLKEHPGCSICYCDIFHFYEKEPEKLLKLNYVYHSGDEVFQSLLRKNFINPLTVVLRRVVFERIGYFDETMRQFAEDWEFWLRAAHAGLRIDFLPEVLAKYRMREMSLSYSRALEVRRKQTVVNIFKKLYGEMTPEDRQRYGMASILRRHRLRLWYAEFAEYLPFLAWLHQRIQKKRLASA